MPSTKSIKRQQKTQRKELKRRKRRKQEAVRRAQWKFACRFPKFEISSSPNVPPEFKDAVYSAAQKVNFDDSKIFDRLDRSVWEDMALHGFQRVEEILDSMNREIGATDTNAGDIVRQNSRNKLAQAIYSQIPASIKNRFMPHNHFLIESRDKVFHLECHCLITTPTLRGNIHLSLHTPFLESGNGKRILGFTTHALQRICERIAPRWRTHLSDLMRVVRFVAYVPPIELTRLRGDQLAVTLFADCGNPLSLDHQIYVNQILGQQNYDSCGNDPEYRLGYCPIEFDGPFAVAKTFLLPGYKGTPEYGLLVRSRLPKADKTKLLSLAKGHVRDHDNAEDWMPLVKWFHENGIPQVRQGIQSYQEMFDSRLAEMEKMLARS